MSSENPHNVISAYFIGPKSENMPDFRANITAILDKIEEARSRYQPDDGVFISEDVRKSPEFLRITGNFQQAVIKAAELLGEHSIPFWHPRYQGHMCTDVTMAGLLGYFMTMIYNPNNVTVEASPFTTVIELKAGKQLCEMFGFNTDSKNTDLPLSWGHITCDGTVANLESIWVARNLKFYPLTLFQAMDEGTLGFIANTFFVTTCTGEEKLFKDLNQWELLNLRSEVILNLGDALYNQFGITPEYLEDALKPFNIQTTGKDALERQFNVTKPTKYFVSQTRHYSWPKGAAITGIGSSNMEGVELDIDGHVCIEALERELNRCLTERQAVYAVVAVIGSTEEGEVDPLFDILEMRRRFQDKGLSFLVHADAAWGGYFASMLPRAVMQPGMPLKDGDGQHAIELVPSLPLKPETLKHMIALKEADSITVDPHKAGYVPYPAGSLCYRDGRMRFLVTWTSPYLTQGSTENIGVYGVEGSKPGAAAMAAWLSNQTIGLDPTGYGVLLGEAAFTSARLSAYYAALHLRQPKDSRGHRRYIIIPFNRLRMEKKGFNILSPEVDVGRELIWDFILQKTNEQVSKIPEAMEWLREIGSDLNINAFALNWYHEDGTLNTDLEEANYLTQQVVNKLSITSSTEAPNKLPLFLTSTQFEPASYGNCAQNFMKRLGLTPCAQDLWVLRNVVMSPFPTERGFIDELMKTFEQTIIDEVDNSCRPRNSPTANKIEFLLRGTDTVFLEFRTRFHRATQRQQIILAAELDDDVKRKYIAMREKNPDQDIGFISNDPENLEKLILAISEKPHPAVKGEIGIIAEEYMSPIPCTVTMSRVVKSSGLNSMYRDDHYPRHFMPFYLFGSKEQHHIEHMLLQAPNINLSSSISLDEKLHDEVGSRLADKELLILALTDYREQTMQPFPLVNDVKPINSANFFFRSGRSFEVEVYTDPKKATANGPGLLDGLGAPIGKGRMTLGQDVHVDVEELNKDPFSGIGPPDIPWETQLDQITDVLNTKSH
ncbi:unnamed protein product [Penicillium salamii]|uniref:L-tyrosine decarboxylase C-terminal domain-containing protein n=1 Tax=Penicillium salamii TaxID=1612424 RepID=A0A9W4NI87_9EURO|nr:unnamed protein product [Penicillium salamii]CAG8034469.1 unnamed protein product [Penicillium salamii]CAG8057173.1 unnamed protein product [Penicillium salamii]CAG8112276.1 unnamed protein product [Penicillium salamii]CAG8177391.1 unnamed protein product [Penicillium salamii]